jgi:hypothetical protein
MVDFISRVGIAAGVLSGEIQKARLNEILLT